jgi:hypothetical protein
MGSHAPARACDSESFDQTPFAALPYARSLNAAPPRLPCWPWDATASWRYRLTGYYHSIEFSSAGSAHALGNRRPLAQ